MDVRPVPCKLSQWLKEVWKYNREKFNKEHTITIKGRLLFFLLRHGWLVKFFISHCSFGEFETPSGIKYKGFKCSWKW